MLRYRHRLRRLGHGQVIAVLVPERTPRDSSWEELCRELGVVLLNGNELERAPMLIDEAASHDTIDAAKADSGN